MISKVFYLVYGAPGSGKSTFVEETLKKLHDDLKHYEADMFFYDKNGEYKFNCKKLGFAHKWCQNKAYEAMKSGFPVCVSNTSLTPREREFYLKEAAKFGYKIYLHRCFGEFQNIHGVPEDKVKSMREKCSWVTKKELEMCNCNLDDVIEI